MNELHIIKIEKDSFRLVNTNPRERKDSEKEHEGMVEVFSLLNPENEKDILCRQLFEYAHDDVDDSYVLEPPMNREKSVFIFTDSNIENETYVKELVENFFKEENNLTLTNNVDIFYVTDPIIRKHLIAPAQFEKTNNEDILNENIHPAFVCMRGDGMIFFIREDFTPFNERHIQKAFDLLLNKSEE